MSVPTNIHLDDGIGDEGERFQRGLETLRLLGDMPGQKPFEQISKIAPDFVKFTVEFAYGDIASRPGLDIRMREAVVIAAHTILGRSPAALKRHIGASLNLGLTREEIVEIIMQMAIYAGWPAAIEALIAARDVFDERDAAGTPDGD